MKKRAFKFGKYSFQSFQEFQNIQDLAIADGFENPEDFNIYLDDYFNK